MGTQRKRGYLLTEVGEEKIIDALTQQEVILRKWASCLKKATEKIGEPLNDDTIRKILKKQSVDERSIQSVFKALKLRYNRDTDSIQASKDINIRNSEIAEKCPYKGLFAFEKEDARFFFGRENFIQTLVNVVEEKPLVAVVGNSGIGKSSVIRAGLIPTLEESGTWKIAIFRPNNNPFYGLATALIELFEPEMGSSERIKGIKKYLEDFKKENLTLKDILEYKLRKISYKDRFLIVIDQFEELYTLSLENEKNIFLDQLLEVIELESKKRRPDVILVITLRADFYGDVLSHPALGKALQTWKPENLLGMSLDELKNAIEQPAQVAKLKIQDGLTQIILDAIKNNQGELPLLEFTLEKLWEKRSNGQLTISAYDEIGGLEKALANHAEDVYNKLDKNEKKQAQYIFTQLVRFGENTDDTRRLATYDEIGEENWKLVTKLASSERELEARLVITSYDESKKQSTVEVVHEALIRGWSRLRNWMEEDREFRKWQDRLRTEKDIWENSDKDNGALLRGALLVEAEEWFKKRSDSITNPKEIEFILTSCQYQEQEDIEGIQELLNLSQKELQLKQQLSSLIMAIKAGVKLRNIREPAEALKRNVIERLQQGSYEIHEQNQLIGHTQGVVGIAFSSNGSMIASASDDRTIKLWDLEGQLLRTLKGHTGQIYGVSFSLDGQLIASASGDSTVKLWKVDGTLLRTLQGHTNWVRGVSFSPNGRMIASASTDSTVKLWKVDGTLLRTLQGHTDWVYGVSFSPDGQMIASSSVDSTVKLWNVNGTLLKTLQGHTDWIFGVSFSPDSQMIASASGDSTVKLWNISGTLLTTLQGHTAQVRGVSFSPDSQMIASASFDKTVRLWKIDGTLLTTLKGHTNWVRAVSFSPDGQMIASASDDSTVKLWNISGTLLTTLEGHTAHVWGVSFSPDGQVIASASGDSTVKLWNISGTLLTTLEGHTNWVRGVSFSPNGQMIASASTDKTVKLWNIDGILLRTLQGHTDWVYGVSFSTDGQMIASASVDSTVKLWNVNGTLLRTLQGHTDWVNGVSFSPDGQMIASASADKTVRLWLIDPEDLILDLDVKLNNLLKKGCNWIKSYLKTNPNISENDRHLCDDICSFQ
ncbi:MAG: WD40 repeat domain-containing protein [Nostoc sp.]|uniref:WD40 repeat domain-containing protein n=1 Tax=Nostoc sp. TaxID=1180 RepID=UPI002FF7DF40